MNRRRHRDIPVLWSAGALFVLLSCAATGAFGAWAQAELMTGYWIEHCVQQVRQKYQRDERVRCEAEAEEWRYGTEQPFDWSEYDEMMDAHFKRADETPECRAVDEALRRCNEALRDAE